MSMARRLNDIQMDFERAGLTLEGRTLRRSKPGKMDYILALQEHYLAKYEAEGKLTPGMIWMHKTLESPMLALSQTTFKKPGEFDALLDSKLFFAEEKFDGCRMIAYYSPENGFEFFGRNRSVTDYCFTNYTGQIKYLENMKGVFKKSFALDNELMSNNPSINGRVVTDTVLSAVSSLLAMNTEDSWAAQEEGGLPLRFKTFDLLMLDNKDLLNVPNIKRKGYLSQVMMSFKARSAETGLTQLMWFIEAKWVEGDRTVKQKLYDLVTARGGEGLILKKSSSVYRPQEARGQGTWVKWKRTVSESASPEGADIDAYITGFTLGKAGTANEGLVSSLDLSVLLVPSGDEHILARCANISAELQKEMTVIGADGNPTIRPDFLKRVVTIEGQDISAKAKRFTHARITAWRTTKNWFDCVFDNSLLNDLIL